MTDQSIEQLAKANRTQILGQIADAYERDNDDAGAFDRALDAAYEAGKRRGMEKAAGIADARAQKARDAISECENWSPAQAEHSRARDACLDISDAIRSAMP